MLNKCNKEKYKFLSGYGDERKLRRIKKNNVNKNVNLVLSSYKLWFFKSSPFLRSLGVNVFVS